MGKEMPTKIIRWKGKDYHIPIKILPFVESVIDRDAIVHAMVGLAETWWGTAMGSLDEAALMDKEGILGAAYDQVIEGITAMLEELDWKRREPSGLVKGNGGK